MHDFTARLVKPFDDFQKYGIAGFHVVYPVSTGFTNGR
jgi:hypothetical protein